MISYKIFRFQKITKTVTTGPVAFATLSEVAHFLLVGDVDPRAAPDYRILCVDSTTTSEVSLTAREREQLWLRMQLIR